MTTCTVAGIQFFGLTSLCLRFCVFFPLGFWAEFVSNDFALALFSVARKQGDPIGRTLPRPLGDCFGRFFENYKSRKNFGGYFFHG
jgi:hypothetical protein